MNVVVNQYAKLFQEKQADHISLFNSHLKFDYNVLDVSTFSKEYKPETPWLEKKVVALPMAIWSGLVKTVYHLALAIFIGIPKAVMGDPRSLKVYTFSFQRDLQAAFGQILSIFNSIHGAYHVEKSAFYNASYPLALGRTNEAREEMEYFQAYIKEAKNHSDAFRRIPNEWMHKKKILSAYIEARAKVCSSKNEENVKAFVTSLPKSALLEAVKIDWMILAHVEETLQSDPEILAILKPLSGKKSTWPNATLTKQLALLLVKAHWKNYSEIYPNINHRFEDDADIQSKLLESLKADPSWSYKDLDYSIRSVREVALLAIERDWKDYKHIHYSFENDADIQSKLLESLKADPNWSYEDLGYNIQDIKEVALLAIERDWKDYKHIYYRFENDVDIQSKLLEKLKADPSWSYKDLLYGITKIEGVSPLVLERDWKHYSPKISGEKLKDWKKTFGFIDDYIQADVRERIIEQATNDLSWKYENLDFYTQHIKKVVLLAVERDWKTYETVGYRIDKNPEVIATLIANHNFAKFSSDMRGSKEICLEALRVSWKNFGHMSTFLQKYSDEMVKELMKHWGGEFSKFTPEMRDHFGIVYEAVKRNPANFTYASPRLQRDYQIRRAAGKFAYEKPRREWFNFGARPEPKSSPTPKPTPSWKQPMFMDLLNNKKDPIHYKAKITHGLLEQVSAFEEKYLKDVTVADENRLKSVANRNPEAIRNFFTTLYGTLRSIKAEEKGDPPPAKEDSLPSNKRIHRLVSIYVHPDKLRKEFERFVNAEINYVADSFQKAFVSLSALSEVAT